MHSKGRREWTTERQIQLIRRHSMGLDSGVHMGIGVLHRKIPLHLDGDEYILKRLPGVDLKEYMGADR